MSNHRQQPNSASRSPYRSADEIIRSILDDDVSRSEISPSGELYRAIERFHSFRQRAASIRQDPAGHHLDRLGAANSVEHRTMASESNSENHSRFSREPQPRSGASPLYIPSPAASLPSLRNSSTTTTHRGPATSANGRRAAPRNRIFDRHRRNQEDWHDESPDPWEPSPGRLGHLGMDIGSTGLQPIWDFNSHITSPVPDSTYTIPPLVQPPVPSEESRRAKRRKLDTDNATSGFTGVRYGKYGQLEPGSLSMEIVSCDGGNYVEEGRLYPAENILKNDPSVYCTEGPRCNIVLQHQGATVFTLKELVIKAPRSNYTSPSRVSEGMVFVSLDSNDLLSRTTDYEIVPSLSCSTSRRRHRRQPCPPNGPTRYNPREDPSMTRSQRRARRLYNIGRDDEDHEARMSQLPSVFTIDPPHYGVTIEYSDEDGELGMPMPAFRPPPHIPSIGSLPFESDSSDEEENIDFNLSGTDYRSHRRRDRPTTTLSAGGRAGPSADTSERGREYGSSEDSGDLMAPHARFFIEKDKNKCTMTFDPPVSGRFILLKMWSSHHDSNSNIDIQAVETKGYAGPRYFPSIELR